MALIQTGDARLWHPVRRQLIINFPELERDKSDDYWRVLASTDGYIFNKNS